jgi:hypothetical protein
MAYARLATKNRSGLHPNFRGLGDASSTITPAEAMQQAIAESSGLNLNPRDFQNAAWLSNAEAQIAAGQFNVSWYSPACAGQQAPPLNLFSTASGLAIGAAGKGTAIATATGAIAAGTATALGAATMGAGLIVAVIAMIFQHHAAAVKRDLAFGCSALPAVNNAFSLIAGAVQNGQTTPDAAASALDQIYTNFESAGGAAINTSPFCNSNCEMGVILKGMIIYWKAQYQAMAAAATAASSAQSQSSAGGSVLPGSAPAPAISSIPSWLWFAAAGFVLWKVV